MSASNNFKYITITGGTGFLGQELVKAAKKLFPDAKIISLGSKDGDLRDPQIAISATKNADLIIHAAANVGGIGKNQKLPGTLLYDNALMGLHIIEAARVNNVKKIITIGTVCEYPKYTDLPFRETDLWLGYPESTNAPYGIAKRLIAVQSHAYQKEFGLNAVHVLPTNLYGPGDHFHSENAHVVPDLIRKIHQAVIHKEPVVTLWGDGSPTREFMYVTDAANAILTVAKHYNETTPINIGSGEEISIRNLSQKIAQLLKYSGEIVWDTTRPNGQPRRLIDSRVLRQSLKFQPKTTLDNGLKQTIAWYLKNLKNLP